jgi:hypothetical protein
VNSKEENSQDFCPNYVQEFVLRFHFHVDHNDFYKSKYLKKIYTNLLCSWPEAEFRDPDWGDKVNSGMGGGVSGRTGPPGYTGCQAGTTTLCRS